MPFIWQFFVFSRLSRLDRQRWDGWPPSASLASAALGKSDEEVITLIKNLDDSFAADILSAFSLTRIKNIVSNPDLDVDKAQSILYEMPRNKIFDLVLEGASSVTFSADSTISGVIRYLDAKVDAGVTLTCDGQPTVIICRNLVNDGNIVKTATGGKGGEGFSTAGDGGCGGGGLIILAKEEVLNNNLISANGEGGEAGTNGSGLYAPGACGEHGNVIVIADDSVGSGGRGGAEHYNWGRGNWGGGGAGEGSENCGGDGGVCCYLSFNTADEISSELKKALVDWYLVNIIGRTPSKKAEFFDVKGAGGGGGACETASAYKAGGGGGGGSGGIIIVDSDSINNQGTIEARGGDGGDAEDRGTGGGGGGGLIYLFYRSSITEGTLSVDGGVKGSAPNGALGMDGTAGVAKSVQVSV